MADDKGLSGLQYPKWKFHPTKEARIVADPREEMALTPDAEGWVNHPRELAKPVEKAAKPAEPPKKVAEPQPKSEKPAKAD